MQISEFLSHHLSPNARMHVAYERDLCAHLDGYVHQLWTPGRVLVVCESGYRDFVERAFLGALKSHGFEPIYCLCSKDLGTTYHAQMDESLSDGVLNGISGVLSLGSLELFRAARDRAALLDIGCGAVLDALAAKDVVDACGENRPCVDALWFDLQALGDKLRGDLRDALAELEFDELVFKADLATCRALDQAIPAGVERALEEAETPRIVAQKNDSEDDLAQLCEAYLWRAVAARLYGQTDSWRTIVDYAKACDDAPHFTIAQHARVCATLLEALLEVESLEISPEDCALRQPPKDILRRTWKQILLSDGVPLGWMTTAEAQFEERPALRLSIHRATLNWDDFGARLRPIAAMMRDLSNQEPNDDPIDPSLARLWIHAAHFAHKHSLVRLLSVTRQIEPVLFV